MSHLLPLLLLLLLPAQGCSREEPQKLCAHNFIRALVRVCGGPRWALPDGRQGTGGDREILQWLHNRPFWGLAPDANMGEELDVGLLLRPGLAVDAGGLEPPSGVQRAPRRRRAPSPAKHCCSNGCTQRDLLAFCPH